MIRFGPAGLGGIKEAVANLEVFHKLGLKACEIAFTYGVYIKENMKKEIEEIRKTAEKLDIKLSIHAPYYINLNSEEKRKIEESKKRILDCCKIGELLGAYTIVYHPGFYGKSEKEEAYQNIRLATLEMLNEIKRNKWKIKLAPETTGKLNVFGSVDEIAKLVDEIGCFFCIDFAHLLARSNGRSSYKEMYEEIELKYRLNSLHCHFSGIGYGEKGEKNHKITEESEIRKLLEALKGEKKNIIIINESPSPVGDSVKALKLWEKML